MDVTIVLSLGGHEFEIERARLGKYLDMRTELQHMMNAAQEYNGAQMGLAILRYFQIAMPDLDAETFNRMPWFEVVQGMESVQKLNAVEGDYAILRDYGINVKPVPWEYPARQKTVWIHSLARAYHWTKEEIESLWPEEAIAFLQEILADDQMEREFIHSLSKVAYEYDKGTKKSRYRPLHRPPWMVVRDPKQVITKIPKALLPMGEIVSQRDDDGEIH